MRINNLAVALPIVVSSIVGHAQGPDTSKVNNLATAISHAEGFGIRGTIPSRYHNPGDLRAHPDSAPFSGQVGIGKAGHIVFKDDEAGKAALKDCIRKMVDGRSSYFHANMTLAEVARIYAENWRPWVRIVSTELGVPSTTTLRAYFRDGAGPAPLAVSFHPQPAANPAPLPPVLSFRPLCVASAAPLPPVVSLPESGRVLDALLDVPVDVPPLVEDDAPQHHKFQRLLPVRYHMDRQ
jgi:hypothetical protein